MRGRLDMVNIKKDSLNELLFSLSYIAYLLFSLLNSTFYSINVHSSLKIVAVFCLGILVIKEVFGFNIGYKNILFLITTVFLTIIFYMYLGFWQALLPLYIFAARNVDIRIILKRSYIISLLILIFVVVSSQIGWIENYITFGARERQYLGFLYALYPSTILCNIIFIKVYLEKESISWKTLIIFFILNYILFVYTDSRLTFYLGDIMLLFALSLKKIPNIKKLILSRMSILVYTLVTLLSLYFTLMYNYLIEWQATVNEWLGNRLSLGNSTLNYYGYGLLGQRVNLVGNGLDSSGELNTSSSYDYVDNLYVQLLLKLGILFLIFFVVVMTYITYRAYKEKNVYLLLILMLLAFHGIIDDLIIQIQYNTFWLVIPSLFGYNKLQETNYKINKV